MRITALEELLLFWAVAGIIWLISLAFKGKTKTAIQWIALLLAFIPIVGQMIARAVAAY